MMESLIYAENWRKQFVTFTNDNINFGEYVPRQILNFSTIKYPQLNVEETTVKVYTPKKNDTLVKDGKVYTFYKKTVYTHAGSRKDYRWIDEE